VWRSHTHRGWSLISRGTRTWLLQCLFLSQVPHRGATLYLSLHFLWRDAVPPNWRKILSEIVDLALVFSVSSHFMHRMCRFCFRVFFLSEEGGQFQSMLKLHSDNSWMLTSAWTDSNAQCKPLFYRTENSTNKPLACRGGVRSTRSLGPTMTARGQSIGISIGMLPQTFWGDM